MQRGDYKKHQHNNNNNQKENTPWKMEDNTEKKKLIEMAKEMHKKAIMPKSQTQQVKLILNVITPDNYPKKFGELREILFPSLLSK